MNTKKLLFSLLLGVTLFAAQSGFAMEGEGGGGQDPVKGIRYSDAFDHKAINEKFKKHLVAQGCAANVFDAQAATAAGVNPEEQEAYEKACLAKLHSARNCAIMTPARESLIMLGLLVSSAIGTNYMLDKESMGGSFSIFATVSSSVFLLRNAIRSSYNYMYPPEHTLNRLEERFALNKCHIPKAFWRRIEAEFRKGRDNQFEQLKALDFLEFALGLTTYKPKPELALNQTKLEQISAVLHKNIDTFFKDYEYRNMSAATAAGSGGAVAATSKDDKAAQESRSVEDFCWCLKINTDKFVESLVHKKGQAPRYIYLFGPGGIGKTHFIQKLCSWIEELIPGSVRFENMIITTPAELEGASDRPGAILRVLRNQLMSNKHASVVFMDEATWLNDGQMLNPAKRVFNGDLSKISTSFFGDGVEGTGINLEVPPMFIFCAGNEDIKEAALASRFDKPRYPLPKQSALVLHALTTARKSVSLQRAGVQANAQTEKTLASWIQANNIVDFRRAAAEVELFLLQQQAKAKNKATGATIAEIDESGVSKDAKK